MQEPLQQEHAICLRKSNRLDVELVHWTRGASNIGNHIRVYSDVLMRVAELAPLPYELFAFPTLYSTKADATVASFPSCPAAGSFLASRPGFSASLQRAYCSYQNEASRLDNPALQSPADFS
jgi:hypothetical protein